MKVQLKGLSTYKVRWFVGLLVHSDLQGEHLGAR